MFDFISHKFPKNNKMNWNIQSLLFLKTCFSLSSHSLTVLVTSEDEKTGQMEASAFKLRLGLSDFAYFVANNTRII